MPSVAAIYLLRGQQGLLGAIKLFARSTFKSAFPYPLSPLWFMADLPAEGQVWSEKVDSPPFLYRHPNADSVQPHRLQEALACPALRTTK